MVVVCVCMSLCRWVDGWECVCIERRMWNLTYACMRACVYMRAISLSLSLSLSLSHTHTHTYTGGVIRGDDGHGQISIGHKQRP